MKLSLLSLVCACAIGCVQGTASDDASVSESFSLPASPVPIPPGVSGTVDTVQTYDISSALSNLGKIGGLSVSFPSSVLTGSDLSFMNHVKITMSPQTDGGGMPEATMVDTDVSGTTSVNLPITMDNGTMLRYLSSGPVSLHFK
jgi:hypothetical protein